MTLGKLNENLSQDLAALLRISQSGCIVYYEGVVILLFLSPLAKEDGQKYHYRSFKNNVSKPPD